MSKIVLEAKQVSKHFTDGKSTVEVISGLALQVQSKDNLCRLWEGVIG